MVTTPPAARSSTTAPVCCPAWPERRSSCAPKLRAEVVERGFALILDRGGMRRAWLRGRENLHKRYLIHLAGYNLGLVMRLLTGAGTPREFQARISGYLVVVITPIGGPFVLLIAAAGDRHAALALSIEPDGLA